MKKVIGLFIIMIGMISSSIFVSAYSIENNMNFEALAKEIAETHLSAFDNGIAAGYYPNASDELNVLLSAKESFSNNMIKKNNYEITSSVLETKVIDDVTYFKISVQASWQYDRADFKSGHGTSIDILIDNKSGKVIDLYENFLSSFDVAVRGDNMDICDKKNRLTAETANSSAEKYSLSLEKSAAEIQKSIEEDKARAKKRKSKSKASCSWIDHYTAAAWAKANHYKPQPASGHFSQISGAWNCTNFVSHSLLIENARIYDKGNHLTGCYYKTTAHK